MLDALTYYRRVVGLRGLAAAIHGKLTHTPRFLRLTRPELTFPFYLRVPSSDVQTYEQIFLHQDYQFAVTRPPQTIVDVGANIGLATFTSLTGSRRPASWLSNPKPAILLSSRAIVSTIA